MHRTCVPRAIVLKRICSHIRRASACSKWSADHILQAGARRLYYTWSAHPSNFLSFSRISWGEISRYQLAVPQNNNYAVSLAETLPPSVDLRDAAYSDYLSDHDRSVTTESACIRRFIPEMQIDNRSYTIQITSLCKGWSCRHTREMLDVIKWLMASDQYYVTSNWIIEVDEQGDGVNFWNESLVKSVTGPSAISNDEGSSWRDVAATGSWNILVGGLVHWHETFFVDPVGICSLEVAEMVICVGGKKRGGGCIYIQKYATIFGGSRKHQSCW